MKKFLVIYRMDMAAMKKMMETSTDEQRKAGTAEWGAWMAAHKADFADLGGPIGKNTQVSASGTKESSNDIAGYSIAQADSKEAVVAMLAGSPHFKMPGATADVMEVFVM
jgi:hypothetical protein